MVGRNAAIGRQAWCNSWSKLVKDQDDVQILDTPGILWPKFSDQEVGYKLAACGAIKADVFHPDDVALFVIEFLKQNYQRILPNLPKQLVRSLKICLIRIYY